MSEAEFCDALAVCPLRPFGCYGGHTSPELEFRQRWPAIRSTALKCGRSMEPAPRIELGTSSLPRMRSTTELRGQVEARVQKNGAGDGTRTRDPQLGRLML